MKILHLAFLLIFALSCSRFGSHIGIGGRYNAGREQILKQRGADIDLAINSLEAVVREDPTYRDSLTLLGRAYYRKARYGDAMLILQRAVVVNQQDEIAWLTLGLTQLRRGDDEKGLETIRGGLTLLAKASRNGYKGYEEWDKAGKVNIALRRAVFAAQKGLQDGGTKDGVIRSVESTLASIDDELFLQMLEKRRDYRDYDS